VTYSPDGGVLASANYGGGVRLWDSATGKVRSLLEERPAANHLIAYSKDGKKLAAAGNRIDYTSLWELPSERRVEVGDSLYSGNIITFSPDGKLVALGGENRLVLWDADTRKARFTWKGSEEHGASVFDAVAFSPDSKLLAWAEGTSFIGQPGDVDIRLCDVNTGDVVRKLQGHKDKVWSVAFAPDGKTVAAASRDEAVHLWNVDSGKVVHQLPIKDCFNLAFSPDGTKLAAAGYVTNSIRLWDTAEWKELPPIENCGYGLRSFEFSPDGKTLAAAGVGQAIQVWDVATRDELPQFAGHWDPVLFLTFSPDGKTLASRSSDTTVRLWDVQSGKCRRRLSYGQYGGNHPFVGEAANTLAFSFDGRKLIGHGGYERRQEYAFRVWDVNSGACESKIPVDRENSWTATVSLSPDGRTVATADGYGVHLRSLASGKMEKEFIVRPAENRKIPLPTDDERFAIFSPDGRTLAAFDAVDHVIRLWDWKSGARLREVPGGDGQKPKQSVHPTPPPKVGGVAPVPRGPTISLECLAFSPDGQLFAGCNPGPACVWETATGKLLRKFGEGRDGPRTVAFAPDGRRLIVATKDSVDVWDVLTGEELSAGDGKPLLSGGHKGDILCAAISPDGRTVASGSADTTILLWDAHDLLPKTPATELSARDLDRLWDDLKSDDAPAAYKAVLALAGAPDKAAALLRDRVPVEPPPDAKRVQALIGQLNDNDPQTREAATKELAKLGEAVEPALREALAGDPPAETRSRCERLREALSHGALDADGVRRLRAVQALELIATPDARAALKALAAGAPGALSRNAKAALDALERSAP
jgi:WD40 repeat protein